jgi:hypothetical protein
MISTDRTDQGWTVYGPNDEVLGHVRMTDDLETGDRHDTGKFFAIPVEGKLDEDELVSDTMEAALWILFEHAGSPDYGLLPGGQR